MPLVMPRSPPWVKPSSIRMPSRIRPQANDDGSNDQGNSANNTNNDGTDLVVLTMPVRVS